MARKYLDADRISSFPSTKRASVNKLMTENSVTRLINRLIDLDGYVITNGLEDVDFNQDVIIDAWSAGWSGNNKDFEFVIRGYYFNIPATSEESGLAYLLRETSFDFDDEVDHYLKARIFIDKTDPDYPELFGQDEFPDHTYAAISFYIASSEDDTSEAPLYPDEENAGDYMPYDIVLVRYMEQDNGLWRRYVPLTSMFKFNSKSIAEIDGGEVILS